MAVNPTQFESWSNQLVQSEEWEELLRIMKLAIFAQWTNNTATPESREELHRRILTIGSMENMVKAAADNMKVDKVKAGR